jgi:mono/diheme cytochrome c family protein
MKRPGVAAAAVAIAGFVVVLVIGAVVMISSGAYNVAATKPHTPLAQWLLNTTQKRSVASRADEIPHPPTVDSAMVRQGLEEYREMCVACHGAPGVERGALGKGINPKPPDLAKEAGEWSDGELFWITKHGIKLAGMPAFGVTHSDGELWAIVAFLRRLETMSAEEYQRLASEPATHAHAGMVETERETASGMQHTDTSRGEHAHAAGPSRRPATRAPPSRRGMPEMQHDAMPGHANQQRRQDAKPARVDTDATEKLQMLAAELLRDSVVSARIGADSTLRRLRENQGVRTDTARPPR